MGQKYNYTWLWQQNNSLTAFLNIRILNRYTTGLIMLFSSTRKTENALANENTRDALGTSKGKATVNSMAGILHIRNDITNTTITLCLFLSLSNLLWCSKMTCATICLLCLPMTLSILQLQNTIMVMVIPSTIAISNRT